MRSPHMVDIFTQSARTARNDRLPFTIEQLELKIRQLVIGPD